MTRDAPGAPLTWDSCVDFHVAVAIASSDK